MRRKVVLKQALSGITLQVTNAVLSIIKVPILIQGLGENEYVRIAVIISFWSYISFRGEVNRKNARITYIKNHELILLEKDYLTGIMGILATALLLINRDQREHWPETISAMIMTVICGYIYSKNARTVGFLEASSRINHVNFLQTLSQIVIFPLFILAANYGNFFITYLVFLLSFVGGGVLLHVSSRSLIGKVKSSSSVNESRIWKEVTLWEMIPSSLFPLIISLVCTNSDLLNFLVYQKFVIAFAVLPIAMGPLYSMLDFQFNSKLVKKFIRTINLTFLSSLVCLIIVFEEFIVGFISNGQVSPSPKLLYSVVLSGFLSVIISPFQNAASYGIKLDSRLFALRLHVPISILLLVLTASLYGSYFGFVVSAYLSLLVNLTTRNRINSN